MTRIPLAVATAAAAAVLAPAAAVADLGPHSNLYDQHPNATGGSTDVTVAYDRVKHRASVSVTNHCLGTFTFHGHKYASTASAMSVKVVAGKGNWHGKMVSYVTATKTRKFPAAVAVTIKPKQAAGNVKFLTGTCGTIRFTAKLIAHTK